MADDLEQQNPNPNPTDPQPNPSLIADPKPTIDPADPTKPAEPKVEEKKADDAPKADDKVEPLAFDDIPDLPEELNRDDPLAKEFLELLNNPPKDKGEFASKLVDMQKRAQEANLQAWADVNAGWVEEVKNDPKIGGDKLDANLSKVAKLIDTYSAGHGEKREEIGTKLRTAFAFTGAGNQPDIVKFMIWAADQSSEGAPLSGAPASGEVNRADKLFGT